MKSIKSALRRSSRCALVIAVLLILAVSPRVIAAATDMLKATVVPAPAQASALSISGLDLHDGMVSKFGDTYYMYGTMYGCGYQWGNASTPWCGFGVSTASSLSGPWSTPKLLFSPSSINSFNGQTWASTCAGSGCFNPRVVQRNWGPKDGVFMLWFNAPGDWSKTQANAYYVMGCNGPAGQCGASAGAPYGSTRKPPLYICGGNGDFSIVTDGSTNPSIVCTNANQTLSQEKLDFWGTTGTGVGSTRLAGLTNVESPGIYKDPATGKWIMTYSDVNCGYCSGDGTSYALANSSMGPWSTVVNTGAAAPVAGRRSISAASCGGQPRTVFNVDGQAYEWVDLWGTWNGSYLNQAKAGILFASLQYTPTAQPNGGVLPPQFAQWPCS